MAFVLPVPLDFMKAVVNAAPYKEFRGARALCGGFSFSGDYGSGLCEVFTSDLSCDCGLLSFALDGGDGLECLDTFALDVNGAVFVDGGGDDAARFICFFKLGGATAELAG